MIKSYFYKTFFIVIWATFSCPFAIASCDLKMSGVKYFFNNGSLYKVNMNISELCSSNIIYKRNLKKVEVNIFKNNEKLLSYHFDKGLWMPSQSKFFFKFNEPLKNGCFKGAKSLTINLKSNFINSINGHYFNLSSGKSHNIDCNQLTSI